ncbi:biotin/lipoyl-containing protein [Lactococcus muris]|uniref:Biotin/lipoyl-containing protein n=1 Tax=Lactococcus muris TaxID=2941330 RepID=A0ABV4D5D1_9LACT|nr:MULTISPECIES: biotin/lipoyl-containing protein [Lactococcus]
MKDKHSDFIQENILHELSPLIFTSNRVSVLYKETQLVNCRIYLSKLVGVVHFSSNLSEGTTFIQGNILLSIEELRILNEVYMEQEGKVEAIYVKDNQFVMYGTPLILIRTT